MEFENRLLRRQLEQAEERIAAAQRLRRSLLAGLHQQRQQLPADDFPVAGAG